MGIVFSGDERRMEFIYSEVSDDEDSQYAYRADDHIIIDASIPSSWVDGYDKFTKRQILSFPELATEHGKLGRPGFYERYLDGSPDDITIFKKYFDIEKEKYRQYFD